MVYKSASRMSRLLLYKRDASPPSCAVMLLAELLHLQYDVEEPNMLALDHKKPQFKNMNPMGTIPVLKDGDFVISESHAIMKYLLTKYGDKELQESLYPSEVRARALVDQAMFYDTGVAFIRLKVVALPTLLLGLQGPTLQHLEDIDDAYETLEAYLQRNSYVASDHLTLADLSLGSTVTALQGIHKLDARKFPRSADWLRRLEAESSFKKINAPCASAFWKLMQYFWEKNKQSAKENK